MRILHVEDSVQQQTLVRSHLRQLPWPLQYHSCDSLEAARQQWQRDPNFDLVLLSRRCGGEESDPLIPAFAATAVVVLTHYDDPELETRLLQLGALDVIAKPDLSPALLKHLLRCLQERQQLLGQLAQAHEAALDPLTGLYNHHHARHELERLIDASLRHGNDFALALATIGQTTDASGSEASDRHATATTEVLATALRRSLRKGDLAAHWEDAQVLLLFPNTPAASAAQCLYRASQQLQQLTGAPHSPLCAALFDYRQDSAEECLRQLQMQLREAGDAGPGSLCLNGTTTRITNAEALPQSPN